MGKQNYKEETGIHNLSTLVEKSKKTNSMYELNELLRKLIMGPFGDTKFDTLEIKKLHQKNTKWKKN